MTLRILNYGNYGIFLIMGNAGFCPSAGGKPKKFSNRLQSFRQLGARLAALLGHSGPSSRLSERHLGLRALGLCGTDL